MSQPTFIDQTRKKLVQVVRDCGTANEGFAKALIVRLHSMRLRPHQLLVQDGFDAIMSVAVALAAENWHELMWSNREPLPKLWLETWEQARLSLHAGGIKIESFRIRGGMAYLPPGHYAVPSESFRNNIRIWANYSSPKKTK